MTFDLDCTDYSECKIGRCQKPRSIRSMACESHDPGEAETSWYGNDMGVWEHFTAETRFLWMNAPNCHSSNNKHKIHVPSSISWTGRSSFVTKQTQRPKKADITCFSSFFCSCTETKTMGQHLITGRFFIRMQMYLEIRSLSNLSLIIYLE